MKMRKFVVLFAELEHQQQTVLIEKACFEGNAEDYFVQPLSAKMVGEVTISGDDKPMEYLQMNYISEE